MKKLISVFLAVLISVQGAAAYAAADPGDSLKNVGEYLYTTVSEPSPGSIGGEWAVLGLARSGAAVSDGYFDDYYKRVEKYVTDAGGVLHRKKYTEYSRLILALTAIGKNPENVAGYNLLEPLGDFEKTVWQGINGAVWALIALDSGNYAMPQNSSAKTQATREMYVNFILSRRLSDGGWAMSGEKSDADMTAMALCALSKYEEANREVINEAVECLSKMQDETGGFSSGGIENAESCAQVITALLELGIDIGDTRFVKNGCSTIDKLMTYYIPGSGFRHTNEDNSANQMATEQAFYALCALKRFQENKNSLYDMTDVKEHFENVSDKKTPDDTKMTFSDIVRFVMERRYLEAYLK